MVAVAVAAGAAVDMAVVVVAAAVVAAAAVAAVLAARTAVDGLPVLSTHSAGCISGQAVVCDHLRHLP